MSIRVINTDNPLSPIMLLASVQIFYGIDNLLDTQEEGINWEEEIQKHLVQILSLEALRSLIQFCVSMYQSLVPFAALDQCVADQKKQKRRQEILRQVPGLSAAAPASDSRAVPAPYPSPEQLLCNGKQITVYICKIQVVDLFK